MTSLHLFIMLDQQSEMQSYSVYCRVRKEKY